MTFSGGREDGVAGVTDEAAVAGMPYDYLFEVLASTLHTFERFGTVLFSSATLFAFPVPRIEIELSGYLSPCWL